MLNKAVTIALIITLVYGYLYSTMKEDFGFSDDPLDPYYFSLMTMSTVGYGDFSPKTRRAKALVMTHHTVILVELATILSKMPK